MRGPQTVQLIGLVLGFVGTAFLAIAYQAASDVHEVSGKSTAVQASRWLVRGGLAAVALGFALQAAGILSEAYR
jgi:hypothetical protein